MNIQKNCVVTLSSELYLGEEPFELIDKSNPDAPMTYLHGGYDGIFPLVEEALHEKSIGDTVEILLQPDDAFGEIDEDLLRIEEASVFPVPVEPGMMFESEVPEYGTIIFRVEEIAEGRVVINGNHPLAGMPIRFVAKVEGIRAAKSDEIAHGHPHGPHGVQH